MDLIFRSLFFVNTSFYVFQIKCLYFLHSLIPDYLVEEHTNKQLSRASPDLSMSLPQVQLRFWAT